MPCKSCQSGNVRPLSGEIGIHFPGLKGLDKPIVWVFPTLKVCLECGLTEFKIPRENYEFLREAQLQRLSWKI